MSNEATTKRDTNRAEGTMRVSTSRFEFAHGRKPRGRGHWAFYFNGDDSLDQLFWTKPNLRYAEAKREAEREARRRDADSVAVAS